MKPSHLLRLALTGLFVTSTTFAQAPQPSDAEKLAQKQSDAYIAAFNKGDTAALGALYTEDANYTTDDGDSVTGRAEVVAGLVKFFKENKGAKLALQIESARFLTPDVLVEKGLATVGDETTRYVCSYVKKGDAWLIGELDESSLAPTEAGEAALDELSWMIGSWKDNSPEISVTAKTEWTKNKHFIRRSISIEREGDDALEATEVIGYDPEAGKIRSWMFDSEGGFGGGFWRREGNKWIVSFKATAPDGSTSTAQQILTYLDDKKFTWESINRQSEGESLPNLEKIEVVRTAGE